MGALYHSTAAAALMYKFADIISHSLKPDYKSYITWILKTIPHNRDVLTTWQTQD